VIDVELLAFLEEQLLVLRTDPGPLVLHDNDQLARHCALVDRLPTPTLYTPTPTPPCLHIHLHRVDPERPAPPGERAGFGLYWTALGGGGEKPGADVDGGVVVGELERVGEQIAEYLVHLELRKVVGERR
jgi:hypothetical protein